MYTVRYNNTRYHQQQDMIDWCKINIGPGDGNLMKPAADWIWMVRSTFGTSIFSFVRQEDSCKFQTKWDIDMEDAMTQLNATKVSM